MRKEENGYTSPTRVYAEK
jgi:hypothetical protein